MKIKFIRAKDNLGCTALKIGDRYYIDYFNDRNSYRGIFIRFRRWKFYINLSEMRIHLAQ